MDLISCKKEEKTYLMFLECYHAFSGHLDEADSVQTVLDLQIHLYRNILVKKGGKAFNFWFFLVFGSPFSFLLRRFPCFSDTKVLDEC